MMFALAGLAGYALVNLFFRGDAEVRSMVREMKGASLGTLRRRSSFKGSRKARAAEKRVGALRGLANAIKRNSERIEHERGWSWRWQKEVEARRNFGSPRPLETEAKRCEMLSKTPQWCFDYLIGPRVGKSDGRWSLVASELKRSVFDIVDLRCRSLREFFLALTMMACLDVWFAGFYSGADWVRAVADGS